MKQILKYSKEDMMDIAGWMAAADCKRPIPELKEEAEEYIKRMDIAKRITPVNEGQQPDILKDFISEIRNEFKNENWDYLDFVADRVRNKRIREAMESNSGQQRPAPIDEKFTGGEWQFSNNNAFMTKNRMIATINSGEKHIAEIVCYDLEEAEANARLIAAAPAMYEALKDLIREGECAIMAFNSILKTDPTNILKATYEDLKTQIAETKAILNTINKQ